MDEKIGETLVRIGAMTSLQVKHVTSRQAAGDTRLFGEIAIAMGYINEQALQAYLGVTTRPAVAGAAAAAAPITARGRP